MKKIIISDLSGVCICCGKCNGRCHCFCNGLVGRDGNKRYHQHVGRHSAELFDFPVCGRSEWLQLPDGAFDVTIQGGKRQLILN